MKGASCKETCDLVKTEGPTKEMINYCHLSFWKIQLEGTFNETEQSSQRDCCMHCGFPGKQPDCVAWQFEYRTNACKLFTNDGRCKITGTIDDYDFISKFTFLV